MRSDNRQTGAIRSDAHSCCAAEREEVKEMSEDPPVTGAWAPGDPVGRRQFFTFADDRPFALDSGSVRSRSRSPTKRGVN